MWRLCVGDAQRLTAKERHRRLVNVRGRRTPEHEHRTVGRNRADPSKPREGASMMTNAKMNEKHNRNELKLARNEWHELLLKHGDATG